ncbi:MAG TPA: hypothetical protein VHB20_07795 [Verrucomicrobiae bacterium]|jgi:hypothetical protein|nr:hypothetical protein [Verrucomicrobiae bacterium]
MTKILALLLLCPALFAQTTWQEAFAKMPLPENVAELDRSNCVRLMLHAFQRNAAVKALIFMPGATDEFYFFRRAHARLTNASPTLLDAVIALTNQTYIRVAERPPFLLLHGVEDPLEPLVIIQDQKTADRIKRKKFDRAALFDDLDWDHMEPLLAFAADTRMRPPPDSPLSHHFFRNSFAEFDLTAWEAMEASAMAGKTKFTVQRRHVLFEGDDRPMPSPVPPDPSIFEWKK